MPSFLKLGLLSSVSKNKPPVTNPFNHRGITVTMVILKVIEEILKEDCVPTLWSHQNLLQRGFSSGVPPLLASYILQETISEYHTQGKTVYVAYLDAKSAFDVVNVKSLMRRMYQYGVRGHLWSMVDELHRDPTTRVKWAGGVSDSFPVDKGVRQGGILSTLEYKQYINPLLDSLTKSGLGAKIGPYPVPAPTCADDVTLVADSPLDLQTMLNIAYKFSVDEKYQLQPAKCKVVLYPPKGHMGILRAHTLNFTLGDSSIEVVESAPHLGLVRDSKTSGAAESVKQNLKKASGALYCRMGAGVYGEKGLNPVTLYFIYRTYVLPVLTYGLEALILDTDHIDALELFQNTTLKRFLGLPDKGVASKVPLLLFGAPPVEAVIHSKLLGLLGTIARTPEMIEHKILHRQVALKNINDCVWSTKIKALLLMYELPSIYEVLQNPPPKLKWQTMVKSSISAYWEKEIAQELSQLPSLKYLDCMEYTIGDPHPAVTSISCSVKDVRRVAARIRILTGSYPLNGRLRRACPLCGYPAETRAHFLLECAALDDVRWSPLSDIYQAAQEHNIVPAHMDKDSLLKFIINPASVVIGPLNKNSPLERASRCFIYILHSRRRRLLNLDALNRQKKKKKKQPHTEGRSIDGR